MIDQYANPTIHPGVYDPNRQIRVMALFWVAAMFLIVAPISTRSDASTFGYSVKYGRIGLSLLAFYLGANLISFRQIGNLSKSLLTFIGFFALGAVWSSDPLMGLVNKGMLLFSCMAGVVIGSALNSINELRSGLKIVTIVSLIAAIIVISQAILDPASSYVLRRLAVFKMNANSLGQSAAIMAILCAAHAALEQGVRRRFLPILTVILLGYIIIQTGSRGAAIMALSGCALVLIGFFGGVSGFIRLGAPLIFIVAVGLYLLFVNDATDELAGFSGLAQSSEVTGNRISEEMFRDTRSEIWEQSLKRWATQPVIGIGWLNNNGRSGSTMNMYIQVLVEVGIVGALVLGRFLLILMSNVVYLYRALPFCSLQVRVCGWVSMGCVIGLLVHGLAESSTLLGTTSNSLVLGLSVAMVERALILRDD